MLMLQNSSTHDNVESVYTYKLLELQCWYLYTDEPTHDKTNKLPVRPAKTDQPGRLPSLIRVFRVRLIGS